MTTIYSYPRNRPWRLIGLWDIKNSTLSRQSAPMAVRLSALRTSRDLLPRNINFLLLELSSVTGWVHPRALYGMKDHVNWTFIHYNGTRTRDLPAGIIQPYPLRYRAPQCVRGANCRKLNSTRLWCVLSAYRSCNILWKSVRWFLKAHTLRKHDSHKPTCLPVFFLKECVNKLSANWYEHYATGTHFYVIHFNIIKLKKTSWPESKCELYRPSDRRLSAKLVPIFADRGCHVVSVTDPHGRILGFLNRSRYFSTKQLLNCSHEAEWTPFQTHSLLYPFK
jgi:hypothetical protein